ncbi:MAG: helix-turn-helix domain-containing protein [Polyangiaceae bacterium]
MPSKATRRYVSEKRDRAAAATRARVLTSAKRLFSRRGIDAVTISELALKSKTSASSIYALFESKAGVLRALIEATLFGERYRQAIAALDQVSDPVERIAKTAAVARAIHESESSELGLLRGASAFSPELRRMEQAFEEVRYEHQRARVEDLFRAKRAKRGLTLETARRLLWMYTARDVYRLLVLEGGWSPDAYQEWLEQTLRAGLVATR